MTQLTCRGQPLTMAQTEVAKTAMSAAAAQNAQRIVVIAMIYAAMGETSLTDEQDANGNGPWQQVSYNDSVATAAKYWLLGGHGFQAGGGIACAEANPSYAAWQIANAVEANKVWDDAIQNGTTGNESLADSYAQQSDPPTIAEATAIVAALYSGNTAAGGIFGLGGTGTSGNQTNPSLWFVGDAENPDQDYWTTINQYTQDAQMYAFSDGETLYVADGVQIMAQTPKRVIVRTDPTVLSADMVYDNTSFQYTHTHLIRRKNAIQRRASLSHMQSPTQCEVKVICEPYEIIGGDTVYLKLFGPADGIWLVGDCTRSMFDPFSTLTLVQAMAPINANTGEAIGPAYTTGKTASMSGSGTVMAAMIAEADSINDAQFPYVWGGGHTAAGTPSIGTSGGPGYNGSTKGFDCSGCTAAVLAAGGLYQEGSPVPGDAALTQSLLRNGIIRPGAGSGNPECTLYDNPGVHVFLRLNGVVFGTSDGGGTPLHSGGSGGAWLSNGPDTSTFNAYHVPQSILGQVAGSNVSGSTTSTTITGD